MRQSLRGIVVPLSVILLPHLARELDRFHQRGLGAAEGLLQLLERRLLGSIHAESHLMHLVGVRFRPRFPFWLLKHFGPEPWFRHVLEAVGIGHEMGGIPVFHSPD
jgi:hypothetical protein